MDVAKSQEATKGQVAAEKLKSIKSGGKFAPDGYVTYLQMRKAQTRDFVPAAEAILQSYHKYQSYPPYFEHNPKTHDNEPNRIGDLYIDLDKDGDIELTVVETFLIVNHFKDTHGIPVEEWRISFSGGKGIHLKLKASVMGLEDGRWNLPLLYKNLMKQVVEELSLQTVDLSIYNMKTGKPFRLENQKRENGCYEVPITIEELDAKNHDSFIKEPRTLRDEREGTLNEKLAQRMKQIEERLKGTMIVKEGACSPCKDEPPCIAAILRNRKVTAGKCDFNYCMQTLTRGALDNGTDYNTAMKDGRFEAFVLDFPSGSLTTPEARKDNVRNRFESMAAEGDSYDCGYAKSLGLRLGCEACTVELGKGVEAGDYKEAARSYLERDAKRVGALDLSKLPRVLQDHIEAGIDRANVDPLMVLHGAIGAAAAALGKRAKVVWFGGSWLYPNLYSLAISESGTGKSTVVRITMRDIRQITKDHQKIINEEKAKEKPDSEIIKLHEEILLSISERITLEALVSRLNKHDGIIASAEFGGFLKSLRSGGNVHGMMEVLSDIYDCPDYWAKETVTGGTLTLESPCITIVGYSTLEFIEGVLSAKDIGSGALARYLLFYPQVDESIPPALPTNQIPMPEMTIYETFTVMEPVEMVLSSEAEDRYEQIWERLNKDLKGSGREATKVLEPFLKRWGANIIKVAMIFQQLEEPKSTTIEIKSLEGAWHVVGLAIESTKLLFDGKIGLSEHQGKCSRVLNYIARKKGKVTRRQLSKNQVLKGGIKDLDYVIESLLSAGSIVCKDSMFNKPESEYRLVG